MVGGTTYEEARVVQEMNAENESVNIVLGGTHIHNSSSFIDDILSEKQLRVTIE
jgi:vacuolar protein sorting-associated protein 45